MKSKLTLGLLSLLPLTCVATEVVNDNFETASASASWTSFDASVVNGTGQGAGGSDHYASLGSGELAGFSFNGSSSFTVSFDVRVQATSNRQFNFQISVSPNSGSDANHATVNLRHQNGQWAAFNGTWNAIAAPALAAGVWTKVTIEGTGWGGAGASFSLTTGGSTASDLQFFQAGDPFSQTAQGGNFNSVFGANPGFDIDNVEVTDNTPPPPPAKVVNIAGVYPHLAMTNNENECGPGAVVPWADRLWCVTYSPHFPNGSTSKLYEIDSSLDLTIRPESIGGTPANRFIHEPSQQLIIGPHFIDSEGNVRNLPYSVAPGRHTGVAAHLTDPDNRVYLFTMEDALYDVNVNDLSVITRYPDVQNTGDRFLFGYHGKGAYSGQGLLVVANNGRPGNAGTPTGDSGVLATWDGTTVADNGGSYFATNDPNDSGLENNRAPVAAQPEYVAGWNQLHKVQTCEVTGPGGIKGNPNPATDPIWTTGFDAKSVILRTLEDGTWHTYRLPKGSYTHDGSHGWHTEWPRIRQLDPDTPGSPYLMHMHGVFYDFPSSFSATSFGDLSPLCSYYKMPVDYCTFEGQLVIAKNDASKFDNALARKAQSNLWFGQLSDLQNWGAPSGHGSVWMNEAVTAGQSSDPFLTRGFEQGTLHLRNEGRSALTLALESSSGDGTWTTLRNLTVPGRSYLQDNLSANNSPWLRLTAQNASSDLTAFFHLSNPYPHSAIASLATDKFAALADIRDTSGSSDGTIRVMTGDDLKLETVTTDGYHQIGGDMVLTDIDSAPLESAMRTEAALEKEFGSDDASAWIESGGTRFRLPKLDPLYDQPFASGWARGFREAVTERELLNCHGTFYEVPRSNSGGYRKMRALATHGKRITDFASWRGLFVLTGVLDDAPVSDSLLKNESGTAALWLGEVDDLWQMGEPRGQGGPWKDTAVTANTPSDPFLMYGYDDKELTLTSSEAATITVEVDFLADNTWATYETFTLSAGQTLTHSFPAGFHAHWVRVVSDTATTADAQFTYGPADLRDEILDWARANDLATGSGRMAIAEQNPDGDKLPNYAEFILGTAPNEANPWPMEMEGERPAIILRNLQPQANLTSAVEVSSDLEAWTDVSSGLSPSSNQNGVPDGFTRMTLPESQTASSKLFYRIRLETPSED